MMGASGGIGGTYGYMPELFLKLEELIRNKDMDRAAALQKEISALIYETVKTGSLYAAAKEVLRLRGLEAGDVRAPFLSLDENGKAIVRNVYQKIQEVLARY